MFGRFLVDVNLSGILFNIVVWLWRFLCWGVKWYLDFVIRVLEVLKFLGMREYLGFLLFCDFGLFFECDKRLVVIFIVKFDRFISSNVRLFCIDEYVLIRLCRIVR